MANEQTLLALVISLLRDAMDELNVLRNEIVVSCPSSPVPPAFNRVLVDVTNALTAVSAIKS